MSGMKFTYWIIVIACHAIAIEWPANADITPITMITTIQKNIGRANSNSPQVLFDS